MQQTLVILKPDALRRGLVGTIISRFEQAGIAIIGCKMIWPTPELASLHYGDLDVRYSPEVKTSVVEYLSSGPVMVLVLQGHDVVEFVRKMVGATDPLKAAPGTIRGDFCSISMQQSNVEGKALPNLIHASANQEEAATEISLWWDRSRNKPETYYRFTPRYAEI